MLLTLMPCRVCKKNIAASAKSCPLCGENDPFEYKIYNTFLTEFWGTTVFAGPLLGAMFGVFGMFFMYDYTGNSFDAWLYSAIFIAVFFAMFRIAFSMPKSERHFQGYVTSYRKDANTDKYLFEVPPESLNNMRDTWMRYC